MITLRRRRAIVAFRRHEKFRIEISGMFASVLLPTLCDLPSVKQASRLRSFTKSLTSRFVANVLWFLASLATWQPFFAAQLGAGAALLGLLFVGLSLNLSRILAIPSLRLRAEVGLMLLVLQIVLSSIMLVPDQGRRRSASRSCSSPASSGSSPPPSPSASSAPPRRPSAATAGRPSSSSRPRPCPTSPAASSSSAAGRPPPVALGMILSFLRAATDAWVLLVEINR